MSERKNTEVCTTCGTWVCDSVNEKTDKECGALKPRTLLARPPAKCGNCGGTEGHFAPTYHRGGSAAFHSAGGTRVAALETATVNGTATVAIGGSDDLEGTKGEGGELDYLQSSGVELPPFAMTVAIRGVAPLLFHRWQTSAVKAKAAANKGSKAKNTDNVESYVYRDENGIIGLPGEYLRQSVVGRKAGSAKYRQDPRNKRASMCSLMAASLITLTEVSPMYSVTKAQAATWDYLDERRAVVQSAGINRVRPAFMTGWTAEIVFLVLQPSYLDEQLLLDLLIDAGKFVGVADNRPTFGRFQVTKCERLAEIPW